MASCGLIKSKGASGGPSCEYCGRCLSVCPSYKHSLVETMGPRARIDLARAVASGELTPGERYQASIQSCMQCLACINACPEAAIEYGKKTVGKRRYYCTLEE